MRKETKLSLSAFILGAGSLLVGTGILIAAGVAAMGFGITALIVKKLGIDAEEEVVFEPIEPALFAVSLTTLTEQTINLLCVKAFNLEQCDLFIQKISQLFAEYPKSQNLKPAFDKALSHYMECMLTTQEHNPSFLSQYELPYLERALNLSFMYLGFTEKPYEEPKKMVGNLEKFKNIEKIDALLISITESIMIESKNKNPLEHTSYHALKYLKFLAQKQQKTSIQNYVQAAISASYTVTSVASPSLPTTRSAYK